MELIIPHEGVGMKKMKENPEVWQEVIQSLKNSWPQISAALLAVIVCYGRLIYDGESKKNLWAESLLCGVIAWVCAGGVEVIGIPNSASSFIGGMVGLVGVAKIREFAVKLLNSRMGNDK